MPDSQQTGYQADQGKGVDPSAAKQSNPQAISKDVNRKTFPYPDDVGRINNYSFFESLFFGDHFSAFSIKMKSDNYGKEYARLRFIVANFPALISKIAADLLFIEPPKIKVPEGDQEFVDALINENKLRRAWYESALDNSYFGDVLFKTRIGPRRPNQPSTVIIERQTPKIYFPLYDASNMMGDPKTQELAWVVHIDGKDYLRKEIHEVGVIKNELWKMDGFTIKEQDVITKFDASILPEEKIRINESLLVHVPNFRAGSRWNGLSDYYDLESLFYAIDNRLTKVDNILDEHSDPILGLPEGILDEKGNIKGGKLRLFERPEGSDRNTDPAYVTWDANLDAALKQIDKFIELTFMMSETSPDILGMGQGAVQSGYALKLKLLRTLAKAQRKQIYYREGLIEAIYTAQLLAKEYDITVDGRKLTKDPVRPEITWRDGLPADLTQLLAEEQARIDAGITTKWESIMRVDDLDEDAAKKKAEEIKKETAIVLPNTNIGADAGKFGKDNKNNPPANGAPPSNGNPPKNQPAANQPN